MSVFKRSVNSIAWTSVANVIKIVVLFVRAILLARWLPVPIFGVYATSRAIVEITRTLPSFGMRGAFINRAPEVADEQRSAAVHFTLKLLFTTVWTLVMAGYALTAASDELRMPLLVIISMTGLSHLAETPDLILDRRVVHRRLALVQIITALLVTIVSLAIGWTSVVLQDNNWAIAALLAAHVVTPVVTLSMLYGWRPVWRPKLTWDSTIARYLLTYGSKNYVAILLLSALDRIDDLWTRVYLGNDAVSFYSQAYKFATYPREIIARPLNKVIRGTFAELSDDRQQLSKAFFQSNALILRSGFWIGGALFLIAPEWIELLLTDKWLPMLDIFRLMLVFTLLDPVRMSVANLMVAMGDAHRPIPIRLLQLLVLVGAMYLLGPRWGAKGVAVAANITLVTGVVILFWQSHRYVSFSWRKLILAPALGMVTGFGLIWIVLKVPIIHSSPYSLAAAKMLVYTVGYGSILLLLERSETMRVIKRIMQINKR